jgi:uncharacterized protein with GYD domain
MRTLDTRSMTATIDTIESTERRREMPYYLYQAAYTNEAWAAQLQNPQNVIDRVKAAIAQNGGTLIGPWYAFGDYDILGIVEYPDNVSAATVAIAFAAGGALKAAKTTVLMSIEEGMQAMAKATGADYQPPSG